MQGLGVGFRYLCAALLSLGVSSAFADERTDEMDGAYLDPPYAMDAYVPPLDIPEDYFEGAEKSLRSDVEGMIRRQSPVKSQGSRGTCSIFSATALLESLLIRTRRFSPVGADLSEEWLEYVLMTANVSGIDGSNSAQNFQTFARVGTSPEALMPYIGEDWTAAQTPLSARRCAGLVALDLKRCLLGHRNPKLIAASDQQLSSQSSPLYDPEFLRARQAAFELRDAYLRNGQTGLIVEAQAKRLLSAGTAVTLDVDFYYGAWNHRKAQTLGIPRNEIEWAQGIVTYPPTGSVDFVKSRMNRTGHSILLVGYDDDVVVTTRTLMTDGSMREFTYKGVYYFKNSWGTDGFGVSFALNGRNYRGYGMITQAYARDHGRLFSLILR